MDGMMRTYTRNPIRTVACVGILLGLAPGLFGQALAGQPYDPLPRWTTAKAGYDGSGFTFTVIGECKDGCNDALANAVENYIAANHSDQFFSATLGDMIAYPPSCSNFSSLANGFGNYMDTHITWPARGDQEPESCFLSFYNLDSMTYYFDLGPIRFIVINYTGFGGHPDPDDSFTNAETGAVLTLQQVLEEAKSQGRHSIVFGHVQWFMRDGASGRKGYCNDGSSSEPCQLGVTGDVCPCRGSGTVSLFEANDVKMVFQADNQGYNRATVNGIEYVHASLMKRSSGSEGHCENNGGWLDVPANCQAFFVEVEVDGSNITMRAIEAPSGNVFDTVTVQAGPPDTTPPSIPQNVAATPSGPDIDLSWSAASDPESGILNYRIYRDGQLAGQSGTTSYTDTGLTESTSYTYEVSARNGSGVESARSAAVSATTLPDMIPPDIDSITAVLFPTRVTVVFSEPVEQASASTAANYAIDNGVGVSEATLEPDLRTVTLTTSALTEGPVYTLTVNNVRDRAANPNPVAPGTQSTFSHIATAVREIRISNGDDDVEEAGGSVNMGSSDLEMVMDGGTTQIVGLRFYPVNIQQGATVHAAWVQFQVDEVTTDPASLVVEGEASDDAAPFGSVTSRPRVPTQLTWIPAPWTAAGDAGPGERTTDIAGIIQQIVNRPGWSAGNAMALIISGSGKRTAESFDGTPSAAPMLHVEYSFAPPPSDPPDPPVGLVVQ